MLILTPIRSLDIFGKASIIVEGSAIIGAEILHRCFRRLFHGIILRGLSSY